MSIRQSSRSSTTLPFAQPFHFVERHMLDEGTFQRMIYMERKRSERSRKPLLLMMLDVGKACSSNGHSLPAIVSILSARTRETDLTGWYKNGSVAAVMFTEINLQDKDRVLSTILHRVSDALREQLSMEQFSQIQVTFHVFPETWNNESAPSRTNPTFYPDLESQARSRRSLLLMKRLMDVVGSVLALVALAPVFLAIASVIRLSSAGPILFRQRRIGHHGVPFDLLKFRTMYVNSDSSIHREYVKKLVAGRAEKQVTNGNGKQDGVYKLTSDPRITPVGAFLRRSSLDELPQFINVLKGEMSLVGPRPPLHYEVEDYALWHRRRLLEAKPGITGLWQVNGRNRITFDDMVRLDLRYAKTWSPWLDLKILLRTPLAVIEGAH
ncbi:MAG: sugar transferase [Acidobacteria bacterium]|nr:sugar transferase [Acidobacteriota bacterium]